MRKKTLVDLIGDNTTVIDLEGKVLTPGFIEGHGHLMGVGYNELNLDFMNVKSFDEMIEMVRNAASQGATRTMDHRERMAPG